MTLDVARCGSGPDLVLLHGWGLHRAVWDDIVPALAARHRVHLVDLPGHGASRDVPFESLDATVARVAGITPDGASLCGWSLGGLVALALAIRHPGKLSRLALVGATACFVQRPGWPHATKRETLEEFARGMRDDPQATIARFFALNTLGMAGARAQARALAARLARMAPPSATVLDESLVALREVDLRTQAASLSTPTLVMHGRLDRLAPFAAGRWLADNIPHAQWVPFHDAAHLPFMSHRDEFVAALENFHG
jgi:pimeloyl-[acyl-carrier protein] methyl ester esterase